MTAPYLGFSFRRDPLEPAPPSNAIMSIVGMVGPFGKTATTSQAAFDAAFPLNWPVMFTSTDAKAAMIDPASEIGDALDGINNQLARMETCARCIVVRTEEGTPATDDPDAELWTTISNIIGSSTQGTGIWALKRAGAICGAYPRLVCVPGYTTQRPTGVSAITVTNGGSGIANCTASIAGHPEVELTPVVVGGVLQSITIDHGGWGLDPETPVDVTFGGTSTEAPTVTVTVDDLANPVIASLHAVLSSYLGVSVVDINPETAAGAISDRETIQSDRIIPVTPKVNKLEGANIVKRSFAARVIGIAVRRDFEYEGRPFHAWCNQPVYGIVGPTRHIDYNLTDGAVEGQDLLSREIGILVRGESGDDFAIADGGYVALVIDNAGEEAIWQQLHKVRGRDFAELTTLRTLRYYLGRYNLTSHVIHTIVEVVDDILRGCQSKGDILGRLVRFDPAENNRSDLRAGRIYVDMRFEEAPMFRHATMISRPYGPALDATIAELTASTVLTETPATSTSLMPAA